MLVLTVPNRPFGCAPGVVSQAQYLIVHSGTDSRGKPLSLTVNSRGLIYAGALQEEDVLIAGNNSDSSGQLKGRRRVPSRSVDEPPTVPPPRALPATFQDRRPPCPRRPAEHQQLRPRGPLHRVRNPSTGEQLCALLGTSRGYTNRAPKLSLPHTQAGPPPADLPSEERSARWARDPSTGRKSPRREQSLSWGCPKTPPAPRLRSWSDYESVSECWEVICKIFEEPSDGGADRIG